MIFSANFKKSHKLAEVLVSIRRKTIFALELSVALWYNDANNLIRCGGLAEMMWTAMGYWGADLSKTFSKKSLEIVLEAEILALLGVLDFGKDKTPKPLDTSGFSAFSIV